MEGGEIMTTNDMQKIISKQVELLADRSEFATRPDELAVLSEAMVALIRVYMDT